ncbi:hypothetical protein FKM82_024535 [Ascaphus truei]
MAPHITVRYSFFSPSYSALKKDGKRLSSLLREGAEVEAKPARPVTVYSLSVSAFQPPLFTLDVECGGGFYVRSLVSDIGKCKCTALILNLTVIVQTSPDYVRTLSTFYSCITGHKNRVKKNLSALQMLEPFRSRGAKQCN